MVEAMNKKTEVLPDGWTLTVEDMWETGEDGIMGKVISLTPPPQIPIEQPPVPPKDSQYP
jgi:hypothetical protein